VRANEAVVAKVYNYAVVICRVFNHLKGEADALCLSRLHVIRGRDVVEQLLLRTKGFERIIWHKSRSSYFINLLGEQTPVLVQTFLDRVASVADNHPYYRASPLGYCPGGLADALVGHKVQGAHPILRRIKGVTILGVTLLGLIVLWAIWFIIVFFIDFNWICTEKCA